MAVPTLTATYVVASWDVTTGSQTVTLTTAAGDNLVIVAVTEDASTTLNTPTGNGLTYTLARSSTAASTTAVYAWTATDAVGGTGWTMTISASSTGARIGFAVLRYSSSTGFDASNVGSNASASAPSVSLTTTSNNSAVVWVSGDWTASDGTSRTYRTVNGITPAAGNGEVVYNLSSSHYTVYIAAWSDAGTAAAGTYGLSAPSSQAWAGITVGVKGTASAASLPRPPLVRPPLAPIRASTW